jgi:hypothetical protein
MSIVLYFIGGQTSGLTTLLKTLYSSHSHPYYSTIGKIFSLYTCRDYNLTLL